jgi:hypothetical protein
MTKEKAAAKVEDAIVRFCRKPTEYFAERVHAELMARVEEIADIQNRSTREVLTEIFSHYVAEGLTASWLWREKDFPNTMVSEWTASRFPRFARRNWREWEESLLPPPSFADLTASALDEIHARALGIRL